MLVVPFSFVAFTVWVSPLETHDPKTSMVGVEIPLSISSACLESLVSDGRSKASRFSLKCMIARNIIVFVGIFGKGKWPLLSKYFSWKSCAFHCKIMVSHHSVVHQVLVFFSFAFGILSTPCSSGNAGAPSMLRHNLCPRCRVVCGTTARGTRSVATAWGCCRSLFMSCHA